MILIGSILVLSAILLLKYLFSLKRSKGPFKSFQEIPCPGKLPIVGNITDFFCSEEKLWEINLERALKHYPIYRLELFGTNVVCPLHPDDLQMILDDIKLSNKGPIHDTLKKWTGDGLVVSEGETWQNHRKLLTKGFHFGVLREYLGIFNKYSKILIDRFEKQLQKPIDVMPLITHMMLRSINEAMFGKTSVITEEDMDTYGAAVTTMSRVSYFKSSRPYLEFLYNFSNMKKEEDHALEVIRNFSSKLLKNYESKTDVDDDNQKIIDIMLNAPHIFDDQGIMDEINTFAFGGHDTTSTGLSFILLILSNYPEHQENLYQEIVEVSGKEKPPTQAELAEMPFLDRFLKECLRYYPPVVLIAREIQKDIVTKTGYEIPAGTQVVINLYHIHHNPNHFPNPGKFDPDRFLLDNIIDRHTFAYIPFSAGRRNCIAQKYAVLELKASICAILQKFIVKPGDLIENVILSPDDFLRPKEEIKIKFSLRT